MLLLQSQDSLEVFLVALFPTVMDVGLALQVEFSLQLVVSLAKLLRHPGLLFW
jgi:hypothetical protein